MRITINGEIKTFEPKEISATLENLITHLDYDPRLIVVEFNGTILTPEHWKQQKVQDGDSIEIVTIVGGGN